MDVFIPNFHSALEVVTNSSSNILETNLKVTFCKTSTDVHNPLLRSFRPTLWFCCLKLWSSKMSASCTQNKPNRGKLFLCCQRKKVRVWERP